MGDGEAVSSERPLSPASRLFHSPRFNCYIIAIMGCKTSINPDVVKAGLEQTLLKHPRFSSKLVVDGNKCFGKKKWRRTAVNLEDHVIVPVVDPKTELPDRFVEDYISNLTTTPLDLSKPLWEVHLLNIKTSDAEAVGVFRIHHSLGDGASLVSLLLACTRKTSDPEALPTIPVKKRAGSTHSGRFWWFLLAIWYLIRLICNTLVDLLLFVATILFLKDSKTPIKGAAGVELNTKKFVHRTVSLDDIKLVKSAMNMTINDIVLGITQAGLSRYLNRRYSEDEKDGQPKQWKCHAPKSSRLRACILVNLRQAAGIQELADMMAKGSKTRWGNLIGYMLLPFNIALHDDPLDYVQQAKATVDRKKLSLEAICTFLSAELVLRVFGVKVAAAITHKVLSNTTMAISSLVGPQEEISFYGHPMAYLAPSVYGHPHALTIHFQSYVNKMTITVAADPNVVPDPHQLCNDLEESLKLIRDSVVKKGLIKDVV
ncbi:O-acyltransferase WSD1 [Morella rubra]|uniref:O-acyltransferase WSD1 n=1 Tax=Morella rubra TaxID=262757 RepID=A0A6A1UXC2_9ROSI|nr:O-acyltransferase WSD1 [Morella rubra]